MLKSAELFGVPRSFFAQIERTNIMIALMKDEEIKRLGFWDTLQDYFRQQARVDMYETHLALASDRKRRLEDKLLSAGVLHDEKKTNEDTL